MRRCILYIFVSKTVIKGPSKQVRICVRIAYKLTRVLIILMTPITTDVNTYQEKKCIFFTSYLCAGNRTRNSMATCTHNRTTIFPNTSKPIVKVSDDLFTLNKMAKMRFSLQVCQSRLLQKLKQVFNQSYLKYV
jgi:hypothetical protein